MRGINLLKEFKVNEYYLVRIEFKKPEGVVYRNIKAMKYPEFLKKYPEKALLKGLKVSEIKVVKKFQSYEE